MTEPKRGFFRELATIWREGDGATRLSFPVMGFGLIRRGQVIKGLLYLVSQILLVWFLVDFSWPYLSKLGTLGTQGMQRVWSEERQIFVRTPGDNSLLILLFSVMSLLLVLAFIGIWRSSLRAAFLAQQRETQGKTQPTFAQDLRTLSNERFHVTLLTLPSLMVLAFTVLPTVFMILLAFTNFDANHQPPGNMFT
ncbi:MAG: sugar ABC transporter permease, partial [Clostridiales bacterium]|nr:sugar ABC transporter permease [Clostridiales bacterium]